MTNYITTSQSLPHLTYEYNVVIEKKYGIVYHLPKLDILICELFKEYTPIEEFKELFSETVPIIKKFKIKKFIFDKQNLRVFHQPSMEWYFTEWKTEIFQLGLKSHRKILPKNEPAFTLAVEAGRNKIMQEYDTSVINQLDIQYKNSIQEAIES